MNKLDYALTNLKQFLNVYKIDTINITSFFFFILLPSLTFNIFFTYKN